MLKTHIKNSYILHVKDMDDGRNELLASVLFGEVITDETNRYKHGFRVITSPVISQSYSQFKTQTGNLYIVDEKSKALTISANEWVLMKENLLSPSELLTLRNSTYSTLNCIQH